MGYTAIGVGLFFKDIRLYAVWFLSLCIPIGVQYKLFSRGGQQFFVEHFGGAPDEPIVNLVDLPIVFLCLLWVIDFGVSKMEMPSWTIFDTWVAVFLIVSIFSVYNTTEHTLLIAEVVRYLKYYVVYWALRTYISGSSLYLGNNCHQSARSWFAGYHRTGSVFPVFPATTDRRRSKRIPFPDGCRNGHTESYRDSRSYQYLCCISFCYRFRCVDYTFCSHSSMVQSNRCPICFPWVAVSGFDIFQK